MKIKALVVAFLLMMPLSKVMAQETATVIMNRAYAQAKKEHKNVFVMFHASWCGWCKKMEKNMHTDATQPLFDANYVSTALVVQESPKNKALENPGAAALLEKFKGDKAGLPFWVLLDANGKVLADSFSTKGENLGCPSSAEEVSEFTAKLKKTSRLKDNELAVIAKAFTIKR